MKTLFGAVAALLLGSALGWQTAQAQQQTVAPPSSWAIINEQPPAAPANPYLAPPPPVAYSYPPPPAAAPPPAQNEGYGSSLAPGYRTTPQSLDFGTSQPAEENYR